MKRKYVDEYIASIYNIDESSKIEVLEIDAAQLLSRNRLDIIAKLLYIQSIELNLDNGKEIYKDHIAAVTKNSFIEGGNPEKNSIKKFEKQFNDLIASMKTEGYIEDEYPVPVDENLQILDGAHRVASAIYYNKKIKIAKLPVRACDKYNQQFFDKMGFKSQYMDQIIQKYIEMKNGIYIVNIWPAANDKDKEINQIISKLSNIVYYKEVYLTEQGAFNYLHQIYSRDSWIGDINNKFSGTYRKLEPCFKGNNPLRVFVIESSSINEVLRIKESIRDLFNIGKHSIHITDTKIEAISMGRIIFNNNSIEFMNYAKPYKFKNSYKLLKSYKEQCTDEKAITSSMVLSIYGIREANDLDFISLETNSENNFSYHDSHNYLSKYYGNSIENLIMDPKNYFYYDDVKFLSIQNIAEFKENRKENKDIDDLILIENYYKLNKNPKGLLYVSNEVIKFKRRFLAKLQGIIIRVSHITGTYNILRKIKKALEIKKYS